MAYTIVFRIRRVYFDAIESGEKTREVRMKKAGWDKRAARAVAHLAAGGKVVGVFLCVAAVHRRQVIAIKMYATAAEALGREPSEQGRKDVGEGPVWGFDLGGVV